MGSYSIFRTKKGPARTADERTELVRRIHCKIHQILSRPLFAGIDFGNNAEPHRRAICKKDLTRSIERIVLEALPQRRSPARAAGAVAAVALFFGADDLVGTVSYLTSDDAAFITGQTLSVSGGLTMA